MFKSNIRQLMKEKKIKTVPFLEKTGLSSKTIAKARSDSGISECRLSTLGRIASALEVPVKALFDGEYDLGGASRIADIPLQDWEKEIGKRE